MMLKFEHLECYIKNTWKILKCGARDRWRRTFISVINQLDAQHFCFTINLFHASTCFEHTYRCDHTRGCVMLF